jgi:glycosyltransferase involved in cell wall biosynthesis
VAVLAEEWHTASSVVALRRLLDGVPDRERVMMAWNANNTFGFDRINWKALSSAATITTVSRYMKHVLWDHGVDARVIPNGIQEAWLRPADTKAVHEVSRSFQGRPVLVKVARFDPDKRWDMAVDSVAVLKSRGQRPVFVARGGAESHGRDVLERATRLGLSKAIVRWPTGAGGSIGRALAQAGDADMIVIDGYLGVQEQKALFRAADAVLANSGIEPFGLVGLEAMASGGIALVGCTGEDYATDGDDSICLQTSQPDEIAHHVQRLRADSGMAARIRQSAHLSAARFTWSSVLRRVLLPFIEGLGLENLRAGVTFDHRDVVADFEHGRAVAPVITALDADAPQAAPAPRPGLREKLAAAV